MSLELMCCLFGFYFNRNVLVRVTITIVKHRDQTIWGGKGLFVFHITVYQRKSEQELQQGRNLGAGADGRLL